MLKLGIETFEGQLSNRVTWSQIFDFGLKIRLLWLIWAWVMETTEFMKFNQIKTLPVSN